MQPNFVSDIMMFKALQAVTNCPTVTGTPDTRKGQRHCSWRNRQMLQTNGFTNLKIINLHVHNGSAQTRLLHWK